MKGPIAQVDWENSCLGPKALYRLPPSCIAEFLSLHELEGSLRSSGRGPLIIPGKSWFSNKGDWAFAIRAPNLSSSLPEDLTLAEFIFQMPLKTHLRKKRKSACQTVLPIKMTPLVAEQDRVWLSEWWRSVGSSMMLLLLPCKSTLVKPFWLWYERLQQSTLVSSMNFKGLFLGP